MSAQLCFGSGLEVGDRQRARFCVHLNEAFAAKQRVSRAASWPANSASVLRIVPPSWPCLLTVFPPLEQVEIRMHNNIVISSHLATPQYSQTILTSD